MNQLITFINITFDLITLAIFIRIVMSWIRTAPDSQIFRFFDDITRPILNLAKRVTPPLGMIDFSPIVALLALELLRKIIISILISL